MKAGLAALGEVSEFIRGITFTPNDVEEVASTNTVGVMRTKNVQEQLDLNDVWKINRKFVKNKNQYLEEGDLLVSTANSWNLVGKASWVPLLNYESSFGGFVTVLRGNKKLVDRRYLYYWFVSDRIQELLRSFSNKTTNISNLSLSRAKELTIPLPPLAEQQRIAEQLDAADRILRLREAAIAKLDQLAQSVFVHMFGNNNSIKLKEACKFVSGGTPNKDEAKYWNGSYPWISSADIDGEQIKSFRHFVTDEALTKSSTNIVPKNSILVVTRTGVGKVIVCDQSMCFSQDITGLLIKDNFDPHFIAAAIRNKKNKIVSQARGATIKGVTRDVIENIDVPIASLEDQYLFAEKIHQIHKQLTVQKKCKAHLTLMQNALQHQSFAVN